MKTATHTLLTAFACLACASAASAQDAMELPQFVPTSPVACAAPLGVGQQHRVGIDLMLGVPTGVRGQVAVQREENHSWLLELYIGGMVTPFDGPVGAYGLGGRYSWTALSDGVNDALLVGPGVTVLGVSTGGLVVTATLDIAWLHDFTPDFGWVIGLNAGPAVGFRRGHDAGSGATVSLFTGLWF